ncbi:MAG: hypothetical protein Q8L48_26410 [Archangium sp.]|nr:hypothetical protein [Archangium sp.]
MKLLHWVWLVALLGTGCGSIRDQFVGTRIEDDCSGAWNVCATTVGCFVGDRSYVEGRFPGTNKLAIKLFEPSEVTVGLFLFETAGAGEETVINFFEESCSSRVRVEVTGKTFVGENEKAGWVNRKAELSGVGDHLIQVDSDARTRYLMKIDVLPLRLRDIQ